MDLSLKKTEAKNIYFFGCWNSGFCSFNRQTDNEHETERGMGLTSTMIKLKTKVEEKPIPDLIIVAGDNYYPPKDEKTEKPKSKNKKKTKTVIHESIESGFNCLKDAVGNIPTNILLGNHDIEDIKYDNKNCYILKYQQQFVRRNTNFKLFNFDTFPLYEVHNGHTVIIMLDSTIFSDDHLDCYKDLPISTTRNSKTQTIKNTGLLDDRVAHTVSEDEQTVINENQYTEKIQALQVKIAQLKDDILDTNKAIRNIVFTAHHPIYGLKEKKDKTGKITYKPDILPRFVHFLYINFFSVYGAKYNYYHLCADVHNYNHTTLTIQHGLESLKIEQYIVGTGGAEKDIYSNFTNMIKSGHVDVMKNSDDTDIKINYNIKEYSGDNGFLHIRISRDRDIQFKFISATQPSITRRTIRNKIRSKIPSLNLSRTHRYKKKYKSI